MGKALKVDRTMKPEVYKPLLKKMTLADWLGALTALAGGVQHSFHADYWVVKFGDIEIPHRAVMALASRRHLDHEMTKQEFSGGLAQAIRKELERHEIPLLDLK